MKFLLKIVSFILLSVNVIVVNASTVATNKSNIDVIQNAITIDQCPRVKQIVSHSPYQQTQIDDLNKISEGEDICALDAQRALAFFYFSDEAKFDYWREKLNQTYRYLIGRNNIYAIQDACTKPQQSSLDNYLIMRESFRGGAKNYGLQSLSLDDDIVISSCKKLLSNNAIKSSSSDEIKNVAEISLYMTYGKSHDKKEVLQLCESNGGIGPVYPCQHLLFDEADNYFFKVKNDPKAFSTYQRLLTTNSTDLLSSVYQRLGQMSLPVDGVGVPKNFNVAINYFKQSIHLVPNNSTALYFLGLSYQNLHQYQTAIDFYKQSLSLVPNDPTVLYFLGLSYQYLHQYPQAFSAYLASAKLGDADGQYAVAFMYAKGFGVLQDNKEAFAWVSAAIASGIPFPELEIHAGQFKDYIAMLLNQSDPSGQLLKSAQDLAQQYYHQYDLHEEPLTNKSKNFSERFKTLINDLKNFN